MALPSGDGQLQLFAPSNSPLVVLDENHRLVRLALLLDWTELERIAQQIRRKKLKSRRGRRPHLRALIGAVILMGTRKMTYREAEDQIPHMIYPTELGLMAGFLGMVSTAARRAGSTLKACARELAEKFEQSSRLVRKYRFFDKSKDERVKTLRLNDNT